MIKTGNEELDAIVATLQAQTAGALEANALLAGKLRTQELLTADLRKQLEEALKPKEGKVKK